MKKLLSLFAGVFFLLAAASCEDKESLLRFSEEYNSDAENVSVEYWSPDPGCVPKVYWVYAQSKESELVLECTNEQPIFIQDEQGKPVEEYTSVIGQWTAKIIDGNSVSIKFETLYNDFDGRPEYGEDLKIVAPSKKGKNITGIYILRIASNRM